MTDLTLRFLQAAQQHGGVLGTDAIRSLMADAWDEAHFDAIGCDGSCCDFMHDAPKTTMNPYRHALAGQEDK